MFTIENYLKISEDVYYPKVDFYYPEKILNKDENRINGDGFYKNSLLQKKTNEVGWKRKFSSEPCSSGFFAAYYIYGNDDTSGIIALRGSDDIYDFCYHDFKIALGIKPEAYIKAKDFLEEVKKRYNPKFLAFTGHSLGGALAQLVGIDYNYSKNTNIYPVVCFNAPQTGFLVEHASNIKKEEEIDKFYYNLKYSLQKSASSQIGFPFIGDFVNNINWYQELIDKLPFALEHGVKAYNHIISYKDLNLTQDYNQPAFNAVYDILTKDYKTNVNNKNNFNKLNFKEKLIYCKNKYKFIYNINSHFDLAHAIGIPLGNEIAIDIDKNIEIYNKDLKELDFIKASRLRCELRTILTLHKDYFSKDGIILKSNMTQNYSHGSFSVLKKLSCNLEIKNYLDNIQTDIFGLLASAKNYFFHKNSAVDDLIYLAHHQHSIKNLSIFILKNNILKNIIIGGNNNQSLKDFNNFAYLNPSINYTKNFHSILQNILYKLESTRSITWRCRSVQ